MLLLVIPMALAENPYELKIIVKDSFLDKTLGDVNVTVAGVTKKTNVNGVAGFQKLENKSYTINLAREDYESVEKEVDLAEQKEIIANMEKSSMYVQERRNSSKTPEVNIQDLDNNSVVRENPLSVKFSVNTPAPLKRCRLLLQKEGLLGYMSKDKTNKKGKTLEAELSNDKYKLRVMCENKFGISYSSQYQLTGKGLVTQKENNNEVEPKEENKNEEGGVNLEAYNSFIEKAKSNKRELMTTGGAKKSSAKVLGLFSTLKDNIQRAESLKKSRANLETLGLSDSSYKKKKRKYKNKLEQLKGSTPVGLELTKDERVLDPVSKQETKKAVEKYLEARKEEGGVEEITKRSQDGQQKITTYMNLRHVKVKYARGNSKTFSLINKEFRMEGNTSGGFFVELIPEDFAPKLSKLEIPFRYELVKEPMIKYSPMDEVTYYVKGEKALETMKKAKSVFIKEPSSNSITGYSIASTLKMGKGNALLIFFALIGIVGSTFIVTRTDYTKLKQTFSGALAPKKQDVDVNSYVQLLQTAMEHLNQNRGSQAVELYPQIIKGYKQLGEKSRRELQPMIAHLQKLVDAHYFCRMINNACKQMSEGPFDTKSKICSEIERIYSDMSDDMAMKLKDKYEFFREMISLKNQRQDEKARMVYERNFQKGVSGMVEDRIFGNER